MAGAITKFNPNNTLKALFIIVPYVIGCVLSISYQSRYQWFILLCYIALITGFFVGQEKPIKTICLWNIRFYCHVNWDFHRIQWLYAF